MAGLSSMMFIRITTMTFKIYSGFFSPHESYRLTYRLWNRAKFPETLLTLRRS